MVVNVSFCKVVFLLRRIAPLSLGKQPSPIIFLLLQGSVEMLEMASTDAVLGLD